MSSIMLMGFAALGAADAYTLTISGEVITDSNTPGDVVAGYKVNTDGTTDAYRTSSGYSQIDASTDWIIPNGEAAGGTFHVRATLNAQSGTGTRTGTLGSWLEIGVDTTEWSVTRPSAQGVGNTTWDLDIEISDDGGSTTASTGLIELTANIPF